MYGQNHLNKTKFINHLLTSNSNFKFFTKSRNILSKNINISKINNNYSISSYHNNTLTNISNSIIKKKKSFSMKKINNTIIKRPSSLTKKMNSNNQSRIKSISLRNKKNFLHKTHFNTDYDNSNVTQTKISTETSATSKRHNPIVNLSMLSLSKLKQSKKINSLRNTSLRLHKKNKDGISIISEESAFSSKNNSYNKNKTNINKEIINDSMDDISLTYSEDTETRRKLFEEESSKNNVNKYEDFQTFCNNMRMKLFGKDQL